MTVVCFRAIGAQRFRIRAIRLCLSCATMALNDTMDGHMKEFVAVAVGESLDRVVQRGGPAVYRSQG